jgi:hypothetical protein
MAPDRKFERDRTKEQKHPTNPTGKNNADKNRFDIDENTIKDQKNKK